MDIAGDFTFDAPQKLVWEAIQDPAVLGSVMPGGEGFTQVGDNEYTGVLKVKVGVVQGLFNAHIKLSDIVVPQSYSIEVDGKGAPGFVKATGGIRLDVRSDTQTFMEYTGSAQIGGRIASVGQRLLDTTARSIIRQSLEELNEYLKVKAAQQNQVQPVVSEAASTPMSAVSSSPLSAPEYKPPSQMQVGLNVARDVLNAYIPPSVQPFVLLGVIAAIIVIILLLSR